MQLIISIIQNEVDKLLSKGAIEPSSGGAGFYSSVFVVPMCAGGLLAILNLKWFNHGICIYLLLRSLLSDMCGSLFSMVIMLSPLISRMLIYIFLLLSIHHHFLQICLAQYAMSVEGFNPLGWPQCLGFSQSSLNLSCSFAITKGFCIVIYLDDILVLVPSNWAGMRDHMF